MKPTQVSAAMQQHQYQANLRHTLPPHVGGERKQKRSGVANFTMSDCYEKLKQLVPTIPKNRKVTRVEILQHVIDYIQDLQTALEGHNINVKAVGNLSQVTGMLSSAFPAPAAPNRTPFTTLVPERDQNCAPMPMGMFSAHHQNQNQSQRQQPPFCTQTSMFHHQGLHDFHHRQQMGMNTNMLASTTHPSHKLHPYDTPESSPESRPCSC